MLQQPDGTQLEAILSGDEYLSFYTLQSSGERLTQDLKTGVWRVMTTTEIAEQNSLGTTRRLEAPHKLTLGGTAHEGEVRLPVLLVEFSDLKFTDKYGSKERYEELLNSEDFVETVYTSSRGVEYKARSARNYYMTQSSGKFCPTFDIIGPVTLPHSYSYYGQNNGNSKDVNWRDLFVQGLEEARRRGMLPNGKAWDCDGDGYVDLIYAIFAGYSEAQGAGDNYIWPKNGWVNISTLTEDYVRFGQISMSSELYGAPGDMLLDDGIGTIVHEFGHALGLPDFYDTNYSDLCYGMDAWSVMDQGNYSGMGHIPSSMTVHERMLLGWIEPIDVPENGVITLKPISTSNEGYILRNPKNPDEYLTFENHQNDGSWDQCWGGGSYASAPTRRGLLVTHVDYSAAAWNGNTPNNDVTHQRCTPLPADGTLDNYKRAFNSPNTEELINAANAWYESYKADIYPGTDNVTTLNSENPYAEWFTGEAIDIDITNIEQLDNGDLRITFGTGEETAIRDLRTAGEHADKAHRHVFFSNGKLTIMSNGKQFDVNGREVR